MMARAFTRGLGVLMTLAVAATCAAQARGAWLRRSSAVEPQQLCQERGAVQLTVDGATLTLAGSFSALELPAGPLPSAALQTFAARCTAGTCGPALPSPEQYQLATRLSGGAFTAVSVAGVPMYLGAAGGRRVAWWPRHVRDDAALRAVDTAVRPRAPSPGDSTTAPGGAPLGQWMSVRGFGDCNECAPCNPGDPGACPPKPPSKPPTPVPLEPVDPPTFRLPLLDRELMCEARAAGQLGASECPASTSCP